MELHFAPPVLPTISLRIHYSQSAITRCISLHSLQFTQCCLLHYYCQRVVLHYHTYIHLQQKHIRCSYIYHAYNIYYGIKHSLINMMVVAYIALSS